MQVEDIALPVDERGGGREALQERLLGQVAERQLRGRGVLLRAAGGRRLDGGHRRQKAPERGAVRGVDVVAAAEELRLAVEGREEVEELADALGGAEEEHAVRVERVVKERDELLLEVRAEVDEEVAAADQIELGERRVLDQVVLREHEHVAEALVHAVGAAVGLEREEAGEALGADVGRDADRIQPGARDGDRAAVEVGREDLHRLRALERLHRLGDEDRERVRLLARRAARGPEAEHGAARFLGEELREHLVLERVKRLWVAEEARDADQQIPEERLDLGGRLLEELHVVVERLELMDGHAPVDAAVDRARLVLREVVPRLPAQQDEDLAQRVLALGRGGARRARVRAERVRGVLEQLRGHLARGQLVVDEARRERAPRHPVELGGGGRLRHDHAALGLDRAHAERAVAARAREHDADRALLLILRERAEEEVDREPLPARLRRLEELQGAVQEREVVVRRDDVDGVDPHRHPVLDLEHRHPRVVPEQVAEEALVVGREVLHEHERHVRGAVGGHPREERLEGGEPAGGGADPDDREVHGSTRGRGLVGGHRRLRLWRCCVGHREYLSSGAGARRRASEAGAYAHLDGVLGNRQPNAPNPTEKPIVKRALTSQHAQNAVWSGLAR